MAHRAWPPRYRSNHKVSQEIREREEKENCCCCQKVKNTSTTSKDSSSILYEDSSVIKAWFIATYQRGHPQTCSHIVNPDATLSVTSAPRLYYTGNWDHIDLQRHHRHSYFLKAAFKFRWHLKNWPDEVEFETSFNVALITYPELTTQLSDTLERLHGRQIGQLYESIWLWTISESKWSQSWPGFR